MAEIPTDIGNATEVDLDGILELQEVNQMTRGGTLSARLSRERMAAMMNAMPLIVAHGDGRITGFLMTTTREMNADIPIVQAMFAAYQSAADAYVYGPICVGAAERGKGWPRQCLRSCGVWSLGERVFSLYDATTRRRSVRMLGWECARSPSFSSTGLISPFSLTLDRATSVSAFAD